MPISNSTRILKVLSACASPSTLPCFDGAETFLKYLPMLGRLSLKVSQIVVSIANRLKLSVEAVKRVR